MFFLYHGIYLERDSGISVHALKLFLFLFFAPDTDYGPPSKLANAEVEWNGTIAGSLAMYRCLDGMEDIAGGMGVQQVFCATNGWPQTSLVCTGAVTCI